MMKNYRKFTITVDNYQVTIHEISYQYFFLWVKLRDNTFTYTHYYGDLPINSMSNSLFTFPYTDYIRLFRLILYYYDQIVRALDGDSSLEDLNEKTGKNTANFGNGAASDIYDTRAYNADMMKFRQMVMTSQDFNSSEYGATSDYGLNPSSSSSEFSSEYGNSGGHQKQTKWK